MKIKTLYAQKHDEFWELVRYVVAGALTTLVALVISNGLYFLQAMGNAPQMPSGGLSAIIAWVVDVINDANAVQTVIGTAVAWVIAVIFAFWINRGMVFRVTYTAWRERMVAFAQFTSARIASFLLFEQGLFQLLKLVGMENFLNRIIVLVLVIIFNYIASKFWIFKKNTSMGTEA